MRIPPWALLLLAIAGCGPEAGPNNPDPTSNKPDKPAATGPCVHEGMTQANLAADPRIRALVNDRRKVGIIPIKLEVSKECGVKLDVLDQCNSPGYYDYRSHSGKHKTIVRNLADLNVELPVGANSVAHKLADDRILRSDEVYVGMYQTADEVSVRRADLKGQRCSEATHYIRKIFVGGFAIANGPSAELDGVNSVFLEGGRAVFAQEGEVAACQKAPETRQPSDLCSTPLLVEIAQFQTGEKTQCEHDPCEAGDKLTKTCNNCVDEVCGSIPSCCSDKWDAACITKAKQLCKSPCTGCAHKLCEQGDKLEASCNECAQKVCAQDSFCCSDKWDIDCAKLVPSVCGLNKDQLKAQACDTLPPTCVGGQILSAQNTCVCPTGKTWNGTSCITPANCNHDKCVAGGPLLTSCDTCTQQICAADSFCCNNTWDQGCVNKVKSVCKQTCPCDKLGTEGACEGKTLKFCTAGKVTSLDCSKDKARPFCGWSAANKFFDCMAKPINKPPPGGGGPACKGKGQSCSNNGNCCAPFKCVNGTCDQPT